MSKSCHTLLIREDNRRSTTSMGKNRPALRKNTPLTRQHSASWREGQNGTYKQQMLEAK